MYNKIFTKILDSSIWLESMETRLVWLTFIAAMDEDGFVQFASPDNVAHRALVPLPEVIKALVTLESPDANSSDPENDGRRIERVPGGWMVLNSSKYRQLVTKAVIQEQTRERVRKHRANKDAKRNARNAGNAKKQTGNASVTPSEAIAKAIAETEDRTNPDHHVAHGLPFPLEPTQVTKAEPSPEDVAAMKRFIGAPPGHGEPMKFAHEEKPHGPTKNGRQVVTPLSLGIQTLPGHFCQILLAKYLSGMVDYRIESDPRLKPIPEALAILAKASTTPNGIQIKNLDLRRLPEAWCKITADEIIRQAELDYGLNLPERVEPPPEPMKAEP